MVRARRNWTPEEDALLRWAVNSALSQSRPLLWRELAKSVPGRSNKDCRRRWWNSLADGTTKGPWSEEEDERLIEAVRKHGTSWGRVARAVRSRNSDQCSSHWSQVLDPGINYCDWTPEEDADLLHAVLTHGTNWTTIAASHAPKRTTLALKNRYSTLRLKHENLNKPKRQATKKTGAYSAASRNSTTTPLGGNRNTKVQRIPSRKTSEDDDELNEDEDEEGEDYEEDEDEDDEDDYSGDQEHDDDNMDPNQFMAASNRANTGPAGNHVIDLEGTTSDAPAGSVKNIGLFSPGLRQYGTVTPPLSTENRTADSTGHTAYDNFPLNYPSPYLEPEDNFFHNVRGSAAMNRGIPYPPYDTDAMDLSISSSPGYPSLLHPPPPPPASSTLVTSGTSPPQGSGDVSPKTSLTTSPISQANPSATYQVSINLVCTGAQMEAVMVRLAGIGSYVTMKIDAKTL